MSNQGSTPWADGAEPGGTWRASRGRRPDRPPAAGQAVPAHGYGQAPRPWPPGAHSSGSPGHDRPGHDQPRLPGGYGQPGYGPPPFPHGGTWPSHGQSPPRTTYGPAGHARPATAIDVSDAPTGPVYGQVRQQAAATPGDVAPALAENPFASEAQALEDLAEAPTMMTPIVIPQAAASAPAPSWPSPGPAAGPAPQDILTAARLGQPDAVVGGLVLSHLQSRGLSPAEAYALLGDAATGIGLMPPDQGGLHAQVRLGGLAPLPYGAVWPMTDDGRPLTFVAAVDLGILPPVAPLPQTGLLEVFYDTEAASTGDVTSIRCYYVPQGRTLVDTMPPGATRVGEPQALVGTRLPLLGSSPATSPAHGPLPPHRRRPEPARQAREWFAPHQLLGAPWGESSPYELLTAALRRGVNSRQGARLTEAERAGFGWTLLAQLSSSESVRFHGRTLYVLVPSEDLARGRLDRIVGVEEG